jgi:predicted HTH transcriptional regulator
MREAVINAVVHNDYSYGATPKLEFFSDRVEITSMGGLPYGVEEEDFFSGFSVPRNKEIMRVFRDLEIVEQLGSGIPRILKSYGKDAFEIRKSFVRVILRYAAPFTQTGSATQTYGSEKSSEKILQLLRDNPQMTIAALSEHLGISTRAIEKNIRSLQSNGQLRRVGADKGGRWEVLEVENT